MVGTVASEGRTLRRYPVLRRPLPAIERLAGASGYQEAVGDRPLGLVNIDQC